MSRHRKIHISRSKAVALIAAGTFTVATASAAAAATWPSGPTAGGTHEAQGAQAADAGSLLTLGGQAAQIQSFQQSTVSQARQDEQVRAVAARVTVARWKTARDQAAKKAARAAAASQTAASQTAAQPSAQATASAQPSQAASVAATPAASGSPQQIAQAMLGSFGWSSSQFSCLDPLWAHESGWSVTAYNAGSGAYGIPQALPGSRMASAGPNWQTNPATQIRWGLEYIKGTYGSPCAAWDHEQATGWY